MDIASMCLECLARTEGKACFGVEQGETCLNSKGPVYRTDSIVPKGKSMEARSLEEREPTNDAKRTSDFSAEMLLKWQKGRAEHGTEVKIDPLEEAMEECVDIANYAMEQYFRISKLREELKDGKIQAR